MKNKKQVVLCIMDGWGIRKGAHANSIVQASTPNFDYVTKNFPTTALRAHGLDVGLPENQVGNSEVGHMTIGSGRTIMMALPKIDKAISDGTFRDMGVFQRFANNLRASGGVAHLAGLISNGGVHGHHRHMEYVANTLAAFGIKVKLHCFLDGRDSPPKSGIKNFIKLGENLVSGVQIVSLIGRYFAMDRDLRWERVEKAYKLLIEGIGRRVEDPVKAIQDSYNDGKTDEFLEPMRIGDYSGIASSGDGLFFLNFRADRARQLLTAIFDPEFNQFDRVRTKALGSACGMVKYSSKLEKYIEVMFPTETVNNTLGELVSKRNLHQFRLAETEKYPHVTFFFNAGKEEAFRGESRFLVPSPKVSTYDMKPEMEAEIVTFEAVSAINKKIYDLIIINYANPDMVGHTGNLNATIKACETVDNALGEILKAVNGVGGILILTSDHGNCEQMHDYKNAVPHTSHTLNEVPFSIVGMNNGVRLRKGTLADIAPSILDILSIDKPSEMTGSSLIIR